MKEDDEKIERGTEGAAKERAGNPEEVPQGDAAGNDNAGASGGADGKRGRKAKEGGAQRVKETLRNTAKREIEGVKSEIRSDIDNAKKEVDDVKRAFSRGGVKREIASDVEQAKAEVQQVKDDLGIGKGNEGASEDGAPVNGQPVVEPAGVDNAATAQEGEQPVEGVEAAPVEGQPGTAATDGQVPEGGAPQEAEAGGAGMQAPQQAAAPAYGASVPQTSASAPAPADPTASVNENFQNVAGGKAANMAGAETTGVQSESQTAEQSVTGSQENKTPTGTAQRQYDEYEAGKQAAAAQLKQAQEQYGLEPQADMENIIYKKKLSEIKAQNPDMDEKAAERKAHRMAKREAAREFETRKDDIYRRLAPDYKSDRAYQREQNIKAIIAGLGDFGRMAAQAVTAKHGGTILPFTSLTKGAINDRRISDRERKALVAAYEQIRQGKLQEAQRQIQNYEKMQLDLLKSPASYNTSKTVSTSKAASTSKSERKETVMRRFDPQKNGKGDADAGFVIKKGMVGLPSVYNNQGQMDTLNEVPYNAMISISNDLFTATKGIPNHPTWTEIDGALKEVLGANSQEAKDKYISLTQQKVDEALKFLRPLAENGDQEAIRILGKYKDDLERYTSRYLDYATGKVHSKGETESDEGEPQGGIYDDLV